MSQLNFTRGTNEKPVASQELEKALLSIKGLTGECFFGFPLIATPEGSYSVDATLVTLEKGIVVFDLVEGTQVGDYAARQNDLANKIEAKLRLHRELVKGRTLLPALHVVTFAPAIEDVGRIAQEGYPLANTEILADVMIGLSWECASEELYKQTLSAIENVASIRKNRSKRQFFRPDSRGAKLRRLEESIATLDHRQNRAIIETVDGVQRIRGLAGSGKTVVLALKAAYLHTRHPDWRIAVTFHTRSLKGQFKRLITNFCIEQSGQEPDWSKVRVVNAWGAPGGEYRDGIYYEFCRVSGQDFYDFQAASLRFGGAEKAFDEACSSALSRAQLMQPVYDAILVDEAQDLPPSFLRLCYQMLREPKRLVYAYDELQNLSGASLPPPEEIFGEDEHGVPHVTLGDDPRRDVVLQKCYRNSRPVLVTAHSLGFGIYRASTERSKTGLVQMFDHPLLWEEIGYKVLEGELRKGSRVVLERTDETSPRFLEEHSAIEDLVHFQKFENEAEQNAWLVEQICKNLTEDELKHEDIIVIHPDPITARRRFAPIRKALFEREIPNHIAGVDTDADIFFRTDQPSVTFTGIFRAKGNEAGMVYIINAQDCNTQGKGLASLRNRLFTAITRSKAWVRVVGHGPGMDELLNEFYQLKKHDFKLEFTYPTDEILSKLRVVHRDLSPAEKARLERKIKGFEQAIEAIESGELDPEDVASFLNKLSAEKKAELLRLLGGHE